MKKKDELKFRLSNLTSGIQVFKCLIFHPMETGTRRDKKTGQFVPADYIETVSVFINGLQYIQFRLGKYISKNPYISFEMSEPVQKGSRLQIMWVDNKGDKTVHNYTIEYDATVVMNKHTEKMQHNINSCHALNKSRYHIIPKSNHRFSICIDDIKIPKLKTPSHLPKPAGICKNKSYIAK